MAARSASARAASDGSGVASTASIGFFFSAGTALASVSAGATPAARAPTSRSIAQARLIMINLKLQASCFFFRLSTSASPN